MQTVLWNVFGMVMLYDFPCNSLTKIMSLMCFSLYTGPVLYFRFMVSSSILHVHLDRFCVGLVVDVFERYFIIASLFLSNIVQFVLMFAPGAYYCYRC